MENPGYIRTGREQMLKGGISDPRNKALMKMFNMIGLSPARTRVLLTELADAGKVCAEGNGRLRRYGLL